MNVVCKDGYYFYREVVTPVFNKIKNRIDKLKSEAESKAGKSKDKHGEIAPCKEVGDACFLGRSCERLLEILSRATRDGSQDEVIYADRDEDTEHSHKDDEDGGKE